MNDAALFEATVPVFRHYLRRIERLLATLPEEHESPLQERLSARAFTASEHLQTAIGFVPRTVLPLLGREAAESDDDSLDRSALIELANDVERMLQDLTVEDFAGADGRIIRHTAGSAELRQDATTFATMFALPNFFFHLSMAFAIFRHDGVSIGKADFDGQHRYAPGFHF